MNHLSPSERQRRAKHRTTYCNVYEEGVFDEVIQAINDDSDTGSRCVYVKTKNKGWAIPASCFLDQDRRRWGSSTELVKDNSFDRSRLHLDDSELSKIVAKAVIQSNMRDGDIADLVRNLEAYIHSREQAGVASGKLLRDKEVEEEKVLWDNRFNGLVRLWPHSFEHYKLIEKFSGFSVSRYVNFEGHNGIDVAFKIRFNDFYLGQKGTGRVHPGASEVLPVGGILPEAEQYGFSPDTCVLFIWPNEDFKLYGRWCEDIDEYYPKFGTEKPAKDNPVRKIAYQLARNLSLFSDFYNLSADATHVYFVNGVFELTNNGIEGTATPTENGVTWRFVENTEIILTSKGDEIPKQAIPYLFAMFPDSIYEQVVYNFEIQP